MERILVAIDLRQTDGAPTIRPGSVVGSWDALYRAFQLAGRIQAHVFVLVVQEGRSKMDAAQAPLAQDAVHKRLSLMIEQARMNGTTVKYHIAYGPYDRELIRFVRENRITHIIFGLPERSVSASAFHMSLQSIRKAVTCNIEVVRHKTSSTGFEP
uniref:Universal stress protein n=1 Tax=Desulfatirhabdium butyrativorans TaxID=340467 RepID=A0A7C4MN32_9BACT